MMRPTALLILLGLIAGRLLLDPAEAFLQSYGYVKGSEPMTWMLMGGFCLLLGVILILAYRLDGRRFAGGSRLLDALGGPALLVTGALLIRQNLPVGKATQPPTVVYVPAVPTSVAPDAPDLGSEAAKLWHQIKEIEIKLPDISFDVQGDVGQ